MPHTNSAKPRYLVGGYLVGCGTSFLGVALIDVSAVQFQHVVAMACAALATGGAMWQ
jgi:hypothetical protein